jgi:hypothetical protein
MGRTCFHLALIVIPFCLLLSGCEDLWGSTPLMTSPAMARPVPENSTQTATRTPFQPGDSPASVTATTIPTPSQEPSTRPPARLWISPAVPDSLRQVAIRSGMPLAEDPDPTAARLEFQADPDATDPSQVCVWIYALVTPFPTIPDGVALADIQNAWAGEPSGPFAGRPLWMDASTLAAFSELWGQPAPGSVRVAAADQLINSTWAERPAWAVVPFEALEPRWKVLSVDGQSPLHNDFDPSAYTLKVPFSLRPAAFTLPPDNRDPNKLTVLAMTGVTALVRGTADRMEAKGLLYPGEAIREVLRAADLTHVSDEVSFDANCPKPDIWSESLVFCSDPRYIALLQDVGVDIVELTGNHLLDYGSKDFLATLDVYDQLGWKYFGGGRDLQSALQPTLVEQHGNKLAFIGCNFAGPPNDWATDDRPGSAPCDLDAMAAEITDLRSEGYLPIMTFQYSEYYQPDPTYQEELDFRKMAQAGALIVSGSQAHMPAGMEFQSGAFIHYGLGNLFFDQMSHKMPDGSFIYDTRNGTVDRHVFYNGRYIGTELVPYIIEDYARPRLMNEAERTQFLRNMFSVTGW